MSLYSITPSAGRLRTSTSRDVFSSPDESKMNTRLPKNPKYNSVKSTINTGANTANVKAKVDRSGEIFRRISRRQLHHLILACEQGDESIYDLQNNWDNIEDNDDAMSTTSSGRSIAPSVASNQSSSSSSSSSSRVNPLVVSHSSLADPRIAPSSSASDHFILLDMRDDEAAFAKLHIGGAIHYTPAQLRRDFFPPHIYKLKNAEGKLIVVYDSDDSSRVGLDCATLFIQKGFTNVFLLTGGLKLFGERYMTRVAGTSAGAAQTPPRTGMSSASSSSFSSSQRSGALAGTPASARVSLSGGASSSRPGSTLTNSYIPPPSATQLGYNSAANTQVIHHRSTLAGAGATSLGYGSGASAGGNGGGGRESPRDALGRQLHQTGSMASTQRAQDYSPPMTGSSSSTSARSMGASSTSIMHTTAGGATMMGARAFR